MNPSENQTTNPGNRTPRIVTAADLRARLGRELDALRGTQEAVHVSKRGRLTAVLIDADRCAELIDHLEDSVAALVAREGGPALG